MTAIQDYTELQGRQQDLERASTSVEWLEASYELEDYYRQNGGLVGNHVRRIIDLFEDHQHRCGEDIAPIWVSPPCFDGAARWQGPSPEFDSLFFLNQINNPSDDYLRMMGYTRSQYGFIPIQRGN